MLVSLVRQPLTMAVQNLKYLLHSFSHVNVESSFQSQQGAVTANRDIEDNQLSLLCTAEIQPAGGFIGKLISARFFII